MTTPRLALCLLLAATLVSGKKKFVKSSTPVTEKPHIVVILADDLGWNEVSWNNPRFLTPRMAELSRQGTRLTQSYVSPKCSPSRAALLSGHYPWRLGLQRGAIERFHGSGLNTSVPLLPELLQKGGYTTAMVGKWHLGYCSPAYLPTSRGFHTFFGQYQHVTDYYTRKLQYNSTDGRLVEAHDLHAGSEPSHEGDGEFSTDLYTRKAVSAIEQHDSTKPLFLYLAYQAPHHEIQRPPAAYMDQYTGGKVYQKELRQSYPDSLHRAAAVTALDTGVGRVVDALKAAGMYNNSIIVFSTDNGGVADASNHPLRGRKESLHEGGVRGVGWVHSPHLSVTGGQCRERMYVTDWLATLLSVSGLGSLLPPGTDSLNMWPSLSWGRASPREEIVLNIDQDTYWGLWSAAIISGKYKFIWGQSLLLKQRQEEAACDLQLYNLKKDPGETENLLERSPRLKVVGPLRARLMELFRSMVAADYMRAPSPTTPGSDPALTGGVLATGWCQPKV